jgi:type IV pilus assembly protein PilX
MKTPNQTTRHRQRGMVLIASMLLLIVVTIMALSMFRSYGTQERLAGNTRDKQRAISAAVSAQQYAESVLASGAAPLPGACPATVLPSGSEVCNNAILPNFIAVPWTAGVTYALFTNNKINNVANVTATSNATADIYTNSVLTQSASYYQAPIFYITDLGPNAGSPAGEVYQVDAIGYGGSATTVAVVESTFVVGSNAPQDKTKP